MVAEKQKDKGYSAEEHIENLDIAGLRSSLSKDVKAETTSKTISPFYESAVKDGRFVRDGREGIITQERMSRGGFFLVDILRCLLRVFFRFPGPQPQIEPLQEGLVMKNIQNDSSRGRQSA